MIRNQSKKHCATEKGSVLVLCLLFLVVLTLLGLAASNNTLVQERMAGDEREINVAFQAAESGLRGGEVWLRQQLVAPIAKQGSLCISNSCKASHDVWTKGSVPDVLKPADGSGTAGADWLDWDDDARDYVTVSARALKSYDEDLLVDDPNQPKFVIEFSDFEVDSLTVGIGVPTGRSLYKVSARGRGAKETSETIVQSVYARQF